MRWFDKVADWWQRPVRFHWRFLTASPDTDRDDWFRLDEGDSFNISNPQSECEPYPVLEVIAHDDHIEIIMRSRDYMEMMRDVTLS